MEREKRELNKGADQETQLVTIKTTNTVENKVNIDKIRDIRMALRRRYASRTNFGKIFKDWDITNNGEISLYDAHKMINSFGILLINSRIVTLHILFVDNLLVECRQR